jgi:hypothetical protein
LWCRTTLRQLLLYQDHPIGWSASIAGATDTRIGQRPLPLRGYTGYIEHQCKSPVPDADGRQCGDDSSATDPGNFQWNGCPQYRLSQATLRLIVRRDCNAMVHRIFTTKSRRTCTSDRPRASVPAVALYCKCTCTRQSLRRRFHPNTRHHLAPTGHSRSLS